MPESPHEEIKLSGAPEDLKMSYESWGLHQRVHCLSLSGLGNVKFDSAKKSSCHGYTFGTTYYMNRDSGFIEHLQCTIAASDTASRKLLLECKTAAVGVAIKTYHSDYGDFRSNEFSAHCKAMS
jgi:hypothetical protein